MADRTFRSRRGNRGFARVRGQAQSAVRGIGIGSRHEDDREGQVLNDEVNQCQKVTAGPPPPRTRSTGGVAPASVAVSSSQAAKMNGTVSSESCSSTGPVPVPCSSSAVLPKKRKFNFSEFEITQPDPRAAPNIQQQSFPTSRSPVPKSSEEDPPNVKLSPSSLPDPHVDYTCRRADESVAVMTSANGNSVDVGPVTTVGNLVVGSSGRVVGIVNESIETDSVPRSFASSYAAYSSNVSASSLAHTSTSPPQVFVKTDAKGGVGYSAYPCSRDVHVEHGQVCSPRRVQLSQQLPLPPHVSFLDCARTPASRSVATFAKRTL